MTAPRKLNAYLREEAERLHAERGYSLKWSAPVRVLSLEMCSRRLRIDRLITFTEIEFARFDVVALTIREMADQLQAGELLLDAPATGRH